MQVLIDTIVSDEIFSALVSDHPDSDFIVISRDITPQLHLDLTERIRANQKSKNCVLILTTYGGDPHGGYRIGRCLQHHYENVKLIVASDCKSAGTLIAIAAHSLVIGDLGELGPLDVQVVKQNEFKERGSGLDLVTALGSILNHGQDVFAQTFLTGRQLFRMTTKVAGEVASSMAVGAVSQLYGQIDPLRIGELQRITAITIEYGERLNEKPSNLASDSLIRLVSAYPHHGFVIDRREAKTLFNNVAPMSDNQAKAVDLLWTIVGTPGDQGPYFVVPAPQPAVAPTPAPPPPGEAHGPNLQESVSQDQSRDETACSNAGAEDPARTSAAQLPTIPQHGSSSETAGG